MTGQYETNKPKAGIWDKVHTFIQVGLPVIPFIGGSLSVIFLKYFPSPATKRNDEWIESRLQGLEKLKESPANWIDAHKIETGTLPSLAEELLPLAINCSAGQPISKEIKLTRPSMQFWQRLLPSHKEQLLELVEWLGQDQRDYIEMLRRGAPPGDGQQIRLIPKRKIRTL
ncbi:MAG: hypothetical protein V3S82_01455 [Dehalococcoidia bacterium]